MPWLKAKKAAEYAGIGERTLRGDWLKNGLRHSRLPSGSILIRQDWVDAFLESFEVTDSQAEQVGRIVEDILREVQP